MSHHSAFDWGSLPHTRRWPQFGACEDPCAEVTFASSLGRAYRAGLTPVAAERMRRCAGAFVDDERRCTDAEGRRCRGVLRLPSSDARGRRRLRPRRARLRALGLQLS